MSSSLANCYPFRSESKNKKTYLNFLRPSEMRHSYLRYPNLNRDTMHVCYCWPYSKWRTLYSRISYSEYPTLNSWVFYSERPTPYNRASYSEFPTPYKCLLIPLHRFSDEVSYGECIKFRKSLHVFIREIHISSKDVLCIFFSKSSHR